MIVVKTEGSQQSTRAESEKQGSFALESEENEWNVWISWESVKERNANKIGTRRKYNLLEIAIHRFFNILSIVAFHFLQLRQDYSRLGFTDTFF